MRYYDIITHNKKQNLKPKNTPDTPIKSPHGRKPERDNNPINTNDDNTIDCCAMGSVVARS
jgi:hypothetical protein